MIGNDLVDLACAKQESDWQRPRYLEKIFTATEMKFIKNSIHPELAVWLLWSQKESVYKIIAKLEKRRFFAPKKLECLVATEAVAMLTKSVTGLVFYQNQSFQTQSFLNKKLIHTIAQKESANSIMVMEDCYLKEKDYPYQSQKARQLLIAAYARYTHLEPLFLSVQKDLVGIPSLYYKNKQQFASISLSHHGNYVGWAIVFNSLPCL